MAKHKIEIPAEHKRVLQDWFLSRPDDTELALNAVVQLAPTADRIAIVEAVAPFVSVDAEEFAQVLLSVARATQTDTHQFPVGVEIAGLIYSALTSPSPTSADVQPMPESKERFRTLIDMVARAACLEVETKSTSVEHAHPNRMDTVQVFSELRPVFAGDPPRPAKALILHQLRIRYSHGVVERVPSQAEFYVTMDEADLRRLADIVSRALVKNDEMKAIAQRAELPL